jgi:DNA-binding NtrC family response regulator
MAKWNALVIAELDTIGGLISIMLSREGFDVTVVDPSGLASTEEVYPKLYQKKYDLILPTNNGLSPGKILGLIQEIKKKDPGTKIIVISGYSTPEFVKELNVEAADDYLPMPFRSDILVGRAKESLGRQLNESKTMCN